MTRDEAIDVLKHNRPSACFEDLCEAVETAIQALSAQPEIVRCKDCIHYEIANNRYNGNCNRQYAVFTAYDFCSYGVKLGDADGDEKD